MTSPLKPDAVTAEDLEIVRLSEEMEQLRRDFAKQLERRIVVPLEDLEELRRIVAEAYPHVVATLWDTPHLATVLIRELRCVKHRPRGKAGKLRRKQRRKEARARKET